MCAAMLLAACGKKEEQPQAIPIPLSEVGQTGHTHEGETPAEQAPTQGATISGTIDIDANLRGKFMGDETLFIMARVARGSGEGGPPVAVLRATSFRFPFRYTLSQQNVMMEGMPFEGPLNISVRVDKDGNPMTRNSGDLVGSYGRNPAQVGDAGVDIVINEILK